MLERAKLHLHAWYAMIVFIYSHLNIQFKCCRKIPQSDKTKTTPFLSIPNIVLNKSADGQFVGDEMRMQT